MYARRQLRPKPLKSQTKKWPAPIQGWVSNRSLSNPQSIEGPGAYVLDNFFPRSTGVALRRGKGLYATLEDQSLPVTALFTYKNGEVEKLFGANENTIYDLSSVPFARPQNLGTQTGDELVTEDGDIIGWGSTIGLDVATGFTSGEWVVTQFATTGGVYLLGVNGEDDGFIYDGGEFWPNVPGGMWSLPLDSQTEAFVEGEIVVGDDSGASATVYRDDGDRLVIRNIEEATERWTLDYDGGTADFTPGSTITGQDSNAVAVVQSVSGTTASGTLTLTGLIGSFEDDEVIESQSGGEAIANGTEVYLDGGPFRAGETLIGSEDGEAVADGPQDNIVPGVSFGSFDTSDMSFVWIYQNSLWFIQKNSLSAWYLPPDQVGGAATEYPMGGIFANGGSLLSGHRWSLEHGGSGGLSDQNIFLSNQGEVAIYQGTNPDEAATWSLKGVYRIGSPLGKRAYIRGGGDIAFCTTVGLVPLSKAIALDVTALASTSISYKIADAWTQAVNARGQNAWQAMVWPEEKMCAVAPPDLLTASEPVVFVSNTETGAWARFTNWQANCMEVYQGILYFGSPEGQVYRANVSGLDDGTPYTGVVVPLFDSDETDFNVKTGKVGRARVRANVAVRDRLDLITDYTRDIPPPPDAAPPAVSNVWDEGVWNVSVWSAEQPSVINQNWRSVGGLGYALAPCYQITSGAIAPIDAELIDLEVTYTLGGVVS